MTATVLFTEPAESVDIMQLSVPEVKSDSEQSSPTCCTSSGLPWDLSFYAKGLQSFAHEACQTFLISRNTLESTSKLSSSLGDPVICISRPP